MEGGTAVSGAALLLRIGAGVVFLAHGLPKLHPSGMVGKVPRLKLAQGIRALGLPRPDLWAWGVAALQVVSGCLLLLGVFTPWAAASLLPVMAVALYKQFPNGFVLGMDLPFALLCALLALALLGDGAFSLAALVAR